MLQMGRRRQSNFLLPPHMHKKGEMHYYVTTTIPRKWIKLSKDLVEARRMWAELETGTSRNSVPGLIDSWLQSTTFAGLAANTQRQYLSVAKQLKKVFADFMVEQVKPHHIAAWLDNHRSHVNANTGKSILSAVFQLAIRQGMIDRNPANEVEKLATKRRERYLTDQEYLAIRCKATAVLAAAMDLSYATSSRISDVLKIKLADISDEGLMIRQKKTGAFQLYRRNTALDIAIANARAIKRPVRGLYLLCTEKGQPYAYNTVSNWWREARQKAGIIDAEFRDIRAKAATDAKRQGKDYQALLGHTTKAMSDSYIKIEDPTVVEPMAKIL